MLLALYYPLSTSLLTLRLFLHHTVGVAIGFQRGHKRPVLSIFDSGSSKNDSPSEKVS